MNERDKCVICDSNELHILREFPDFPIKAICTSALQADILFNNCVVSCPSCNCVQLKYLVDLEQLYNNDYANTTFSPAWADHHSNFKSFIFNNTKETQFLEIGANTGALYKLMVAEKPDIKYMTLDMFRHEQLPSEIEYINGNCETFDFSGHSSVILSHVFEHLYNPSVFLKQIAKSTVEEVFISIPNFNKLRDKQTCSIIYSQHTFYCGQEHIEYLFAKHGFTMANSFEYDGPMQSFMCVFKRSTESLSPKYPSLNVDVWTQLYHDKIDLIANTTVPENTYIMPSGIYGQYVYYFLKNKQNVIGFLDNDIKRHGKRLYGSPLTVYSPKDVDLTDKTILLCENPYQTEIIQGLQKIYADVKIQIV